MSPIDRGISTRIGSGNRMQTLELALNDREVVGCTAAGHHRWWQRCGHRCYHGCWIGGPRGGMASLAFHRLSWTMAAPINVPFTILLISNSISRAPPFLSISSTTSSWFGISIAGETQMERTPPYSTLIKKGTRKMENEREIKKDKRQLGKGKALSIYILLQTQHIFLQ